jgi:c-di-GMP-related signal transduction protein
MILDKQIEKLPEEKKYKCKKIICLETLKIFNSITDAAKKLNVKISNLWRTLQNNSRYSTIHNYHFEYYIEGREYKQLKYVENINKKMPRKIKCIETGIVYDSANQIKNQLKINSGKVLKVCKGKRKTAGGYHWLYYDDR